jgi:recombination protein U
MEMGIHRGDAFEEQVNWSNRSYKMKNMAFVIKVPVPVKVLLRVGNMITKAFFEEKAFLDYVGVFKGIPVAFDAKETEETDKFPLKNVKEHQVKFMHQWVQNGGQAFLLVNFKNLNRVYRLDHTTLMWYWEQYTINKGKRGFGSIPLNEFEQNCKLIKSGNGIALHYLEGIN